MKTLLSFLIFSFTLSASALADENYDFVFNLARINGNRTGHVKDSGEPCGTRFQDYDLPTRDGYFVTWVRFGDSVGLSYLNFRYNLFDSHVSLNVNNYTFSYYQVPKYVAVVSYDPYNYRVNSFDWLDENVFQLRCELDDSGPFSRLHPSKPTFPHASMREKSLEQERQVYGRF